MSKTFSSAQVVIAPKRSRWTKESLKDAQEACTQIMSQVKRHVDAIGDIGIVNIDPVCSHCGKDWTEKNSRYNGGCCEQDEEGATPEERREVYPDDCEHGRDPGACAQCNAAADGGKGGA